MSFVCLPKCGHCCGPVGIAKEILEKHKDKMEGNAIKTFETERGNILITDDMRCVFLNRETAQCKTYEDRPQVCRDYGITNNPDLQCPYLKPNGNPRSEASRKQVERHLDKILQALNRDVFSKEKI